MQKQYFSNKMYENSIKKIEEDRSFYINEAKEKANLTAIIELADIHFIRALSNPEFHDELKDLFESNMQFANSQTIRDDYDIVNQVECIFHSYQEAAEFLAGCKLFIKFSSSYDITVNHDDIIFHINKDRISEEITC